MVIRPERLHILSLFSGIGGLDLGVKIANPSARCVCYVEGEAYASSILVKRMEEKFLDEAPIWSDVRTFDPEPWSGKVDCIIGGYPCQGFSIAGKRKGKDDPRFLWPHVARIVESIKPKICFFENVDNHLRLGYEQVHDDLSGMGYKVKALVASGTSVGSPQSRRRLFILAYSDDYRGSWLFQREAREYMATNFMDSSEDVPYGSTAQDYMQGVSGQGEGSSINEIPDGWWSSEFNLGRLVAGIPWWNDRARALGNTCIPLVAAYAYFVLSNCFENST